MAGRSDVLALTISDENASDDDRLVTAARPNTAATMANTTFAGGAARNVIVTTTGTGDNGKTNTIVGTDVSMYPSFLLCFLTLICCND